MHLRRALLLFAMVLGFAALAATVSQAPRRQGAGRDAAPPPPPATLRPPKTIELSAAGRPRTVEIDREQAATLTVSADEPGQVEIAGLGLVGPVDDATPATFPLSPTPGSYRISFEPAGSDDVRRIGILIVKR